MEAFDAKNILLGLDILENEYVYFSCSNGFLQLLVLTPGIRSIFLGRLLTDASGDGYTMPGLACGFVVTVGEGGEKTIQKPWFLRFNPGFP